MDHVADREFRDLAGAGAGDIGDLDHLGRHVARRALATDACPDPVGERVVQRDAFAQTDEENDALVALPVLADANGLQHLVALLDLAVDLSGADAHAAGVQHRVRAAVDDQPVVCSARHPVAVAPDAGEAVEIGAVVLGAVGGVPERDRHGREGLGAHQLSRLAAHGLAGIVGHVHRHAETEGLQLTAPDRTDGIAQREAGDDVGAARNRGEMQVVLDGAVDVLEPLRRERRAGRGHGAQRAEVVGAFRFNFRLNSGIQVFGGRAEKRHGLGIGIVEKHVAVGVEGRAVIE